MLSQKKRIIMVAICLVTFVLCFLPVFIDYINNDPPLAYSIGTITGPTWNTEENAVIGEITKDVTISQDFLCTGNGFVSATFTGATYARINTSNFHIALIDSETEMVLEEWDLDAYDFEDNSKFTVQAKDPFSNMSLIGKRLRFVFSSDDATEGNALTLYYSKIDRFNDWTLKKNSETINGDLLMSVNVITGPEKYEKVRIWLCLYLFCFVLLGIYKVFKRHTGNMK